MNPAFRILSRLEGIELLDADSASDALAQRQTYLDELASLDLGSLSEKARKEMRKRLQRLVQSDADVILEARAAMREIERGRRNVQRGRAAARGYRAATSRIEPALDQDA